MKQYLITAAGLLAILGITVLALEVVRVSGLSESVVLTDSVCHPPCWSGIVPGETPPDAVLRRLAALQEVDYGSTFERLRGDTTIRVQWFFAPPSPDTSGTVYFKDNVAYAISIRPGSSLRVGDVFLKFGPPESTWQHCAHSRGISYQQIVLLWPENGYLVEIDFDEPCEPLPLDRITQRSQVSDVVFFEPGRLPELIERRVIFLDQPEDILNGIRPWPGTPDS